MKKRPKVLYLYAGSRKEFYHKYTLGLTPDTQLLGLNYMDKFSVDAEFAEFRLAEFLRKINFNLVHLPYLFKIKNYDVVFICAGLPLVFLAKYILRWKKPRFVIYNTYLNNALKRNPRGLNHFIIKKAIENIDVIVCTAKSQYDFLLAQGFDKNKVEYHPIGIDGEKFFEVSKNIVEKENQEKYIASAGRDLGRDYKTLFESIKDLPIKLKVATKAKAIEGLVIPKNVEILLNIPYEKMPKFYADSLFVVTPLGGEKSMSGSDTSGQYGYLEPMAAGKLVIVADRGTVDDYITHDVDGYIVPSGNPEALRKAILFFLENPDKAREIGQAAQKKVREKFTSQQFAECLARIFKRLS